MCSQTVFRPVHSNRCHMKRALSLLAFFLFWAAPSNAACRYPDGLEQTAARVVALVNEQRVAKGLSTVVLEQRLTSTAQLHACDSAARNRMDHIGSDGSTLPDRALASGYPFRNIAENIAAGQLTAEEVVADWMASPGHRRNILTHGLRDLGLGQAIAKDGTVHWVLNLAQPRGS